MLQGIFSIFNSYSEKRIKISTILLDDFIENGLIDIDKQSISFSKENPNFESTIELFELKDQKIKYFLKGNIASDKNTVKSIKNIKRKMEIIQDILYVKHYVNINSKNRTKYNNIRIYNYSKEESLKFSKTIQAIKIELYEGIVYQKEKTKYKLISEKFLPF